MDRSHDDIFRLISHHYVVICWPILACCTRANMIGCRKFPSCIPAPVATEARSGTEMAFYTNIAILSLLLFQLKTCWLPYRYWVPDEEWVGWAHKDLLEWAILLWRKSLLQNSLTSENSPHFTSMSLNNSYKPGFLCYKLLGFPSMSQNMSVLCQL